MKFEYSYQPYKVKEIRPGDITFTFVKNKSVTKIADPTSHAKHVDQKWEPEKFPIVKPD